MKNFSNFAEFFCQVWTESLAGTWQQWLPAAAAGSWLAS